MSKVSPKSCSSWTDPYLNCHQGNYTGTPGCSVDFKTQRMNQKRSTSVCICAFPLVIDSRCLTRWATEWTYKKWHLSSRLLGIGKIFVGHLDDNNILRYTGWINVDDLPRRVKRWDPQQSINRGAKVLSCLRAFCRNQMAVAKDDNKVWMVEIRGGRDPAPSGSVGVPGAWGVYVRDLSVDERDIVSHRGGERMGIIPMHAVEELRSQK